MMKTFNFGLEENSVLTEFPFSPQINFKKTPHAAFFGASGSGKTYALKLFIAKFLKNNPNACCIIGDYKSDSDFYFLKKEQYFFNFVDIDNIFHIGIQLLEIRQREKSSCKNSFPILIILDELGAYYNSLEKKKRDECISIMTRLLTLGRSFNINVIISNQFAHSEYFGKSRDNLGNIIYLGKISKEGAGMIFHEWRDNMSLNNTRGEGYLLSSGNVPIKIIIPKIRCIENVEKLILKGVQNSEQMLNIYGIFKHIE